MSKSKSKSKSKQTSFPSEYWRPEFEIYTHYRGLFEHGKELLDVAVEPPPQDGDVIGDELDGLLEKQRQLDADFNKREQRREEIEWESDHLSRGYQATLLIGPGTYPKTWQLINTMSDLALVPVMHFKKKFARARPNQLEPALKPLIEVPGHPAYPSGHSTQNFLIAYVLSEVIGDDAELIARVFAIARRVAENREWAGVHYRSDTEAGEELAREIYPILRRVFDEPIKDAIEEWQELAPDEGDREDVRQEQPATVSGLKDATGSGDWGDPFPDTRFRAHQWNLENVGQAQGKRGVDINVRGAWQQLGVWHDSSAPTEPVRVALIDLAVALEHPALVGRFDRDRARNLDYPSIGRSPPEQFVEAFASFASAHAIACAGIIAADQRAIVTETKMVSGHCETSAEPGCLGIAPHARIVPYRAMTLTEPTLGKRQSLARAVLEAASGISFARIAEARPAGQPGTQWAPRWTVGERGPRADILFLPLPLDPLPAAEGDPLALALAFAAAKIPVIIPSGNKGKSSLSYPSEPGKLSCDPKDLNDLSVLLDLDRGALRAVFGDQEIDDDQLVKNLAFSLRNETAIITVGACNDRGERSRYSQYGEGLTVVAPSDDALPVPGQTARGDPPRPQSIATTDLKGLGGYMQDQSHYTLADNEFGFGGTSAAAAQVTGVVALMLQANRRLTPVEVCQILRGSARVCLEQPGDLLVLDDGGMPSQPSAEFGHGLVDAAGAVQEAIRRARQSAGA